MSRDTGLIIAHIWLAIGMIIGMHGRNLEAIVSYLVAVFWVVIWLIELKRSER